MFYKKLLKYTILGYLITGLLWMIVISWFAVTWMGGLSLLARTTRTPLTDTLNPIGNILFWPYQIGDFLIKMNQPYRLRPIVVPPVTLPASPSGQLQLSTP